MYKKLNVVVIIPTYNEKDNIGALIDQLEVEFRDIPENMSILVVDDESPDGTADIVRTRSTIYANIYLLSGPKRGLGVAYKRGMKYAISELSADVVFEMDADFSHAPNDVHRMLSEIQDGADFVIGSRYVSGGTVPAEWALIKRLQSYFGNLFARHLAGLHIICDCTAGFRAIKTSILRNIDFERLNVKGYVFQVALLHQSFMQTKSIVEVPVNFIDRAKGTSKLGLSDVFEFIVNIWWIRLQSLKTFIKFSVVGFSGTFLNLLCFYILYKLGVSKFVASPIAIEASIISNFVLNNFWTFRSRIKSKSVAVRGLNFNVVSLIALVLSYSVFFAVTVASPRLNPVIAQAIAIPPAMLVNYFLNSYWTFNR